MVLVVVSIVCCMYSLCCCVSLLYVVVVLVSLCSCDGLSAPLYEDCMLEDPLLLSSSLPAATLRGIAEERAIALRSALAEGRFPSRTYLEGAGDL